MNAYISALAAGTALALCTGCASAPSAPPAQAAELAGTWTLATGADEDPMRPFGRGGDEGGGAARPGGGGGRGGVRPGGGGRGGMPGSGRPGMGRRDPEATRAAMATLRSLLAPHRTLEVVRADDLLSLRWDGLALEVPLDGESRTLAWEGLEEGVEVEARWEEDELVLTRRSGEVEVEERWSRAPGSSRLVVDVEVTGPMPRDVVLRRIYDRGRGAEG